MELLMIVPTEESIYLELNKNSVKAFGRHFN